MELEEVTRQYNGELKQSSSISEQMEHKATDLHRDLDKIITIQQEKENEIAIVSKILQAKKVTQQITKLGTLCAVRKLFCLRTN